MAADVIAEVIIAVAALAALVAIFWLGMRD